MNAHLAHLKPLISVLAFSLLAGCSTLDSINPFGTKPDPKKLPAPLVELQAAISPKVVWTASVGSAGNFVFTPAVVAGRVFTADADGVVTRLENGKQTWRINAGKPLSGGVGSDGKVVVVGTPKGEVLVFNADDGKPMWSARIGSELLAAPLVTEGNVVVRSGDSRLYIFDAADGKRQRIYHQRAAPSLSLRVGAGMVAAPGLVLAGFPGGKLAAVSLNNAAAVWEVTVAVPKGATELERVADITSPPALNERDVCAVAFQGRIACFENNSTQARWAKDMSSSAGLDASTRAVFVSDDKGRLFAFDRRTGASLWKQEGLLNRGLSRPLAVGSKLLVVGDDQGYLHLLKQDDGAIVGRFKADGGAIDADPQRLDGDQVLIQTRGGKLYALALE